VLAPPGVLERRFVFAHALRTLRPGGRLTALAPKSLGGLRLFKELTGFGCAVEEVARRHYRICQTARPSDLASIADAIAAGGPQWAPALDLWTQPGIFSWDRPDPGSLALLALLPPFAGNGADFGCGAGLLARATLESPDVKNLILVDVDRRAIDAARRNIDDARVKFVWHDLRLEAMEAQSLDFVVMNPPFHDGGDEDRALGEIFIRQAAMALKPGGVCWIVSNRHLPYETALKTCFSLARLVEQTGRYKIHEARR
jgi:16S rRNA (guanine1207-N2)-methyltransferase